MEEKPFAQLGQPRLITANGTADGINPLTVDQTGPLPGKYWILEYASVYVFDPAPPNGFPTPNNDAVATDIYIVPNNQAAVNDASDTQDNGIDAANRGIPLGSTFFGDTEGGFPNAIYGYLLYNIQKLVIPYGYNLRFVWGRSSAAAGLVPSAAATANLQALIREFENCECD